MRAQWDELVADLAKKYVGHRLDDVEAIAEIAADVADHLARNRDLLPVSVLAAWMDLDDAERTTEKLRAMVREHWLAEDARLTLAKGKRG